MKCIALTLTVSAVSATVVPQALLNLRNHTLLSTYQQVSPLESIAHIATFDEIPIFGGHELREKMLEAQAQHSKIESLASGVFNSFAKASKIVGCNAQFLASSTISLVMRKEHRLSYGSYCEVNPAATLRATHDLMSSGEESFEVSAVLQ